MSAVPAATKGQPCMSGIGKTGHVMHFKSKTRCQQSADQRLFSTKYTSTHMCMMIAARDGSYHLQEKPCH